MASKDKEIEAFREWATSMGVPQDAIPTEDALKSVFSSPQREVFETLMRRVRPRQEVEQMRQTILIKELEKLNGQVVPASRRVFLPEKLQNYLKVKELEKKRAEILKRIAEHKKEYESIAGSFKSKNIQVINAEKRHHLLQAKVDILELKSKSFERDLKKEENIKTHLLKNMPAKLNAKNANEEFVHDAIQKAMNELESFDDWATKNKTHTTDLKNAQDQLWEKLRSILKNVPNFRLFKGLMHLKDQQLEQLKSLEKYTIDDSHSGSLSSLKTQEPMNDFQKNFIKLKVDALALFVYHKATVEERKKMETIFCEQFNLVASEMQEKVAVANPDETGEHIEEVLSEFMMQRNWHVNLKTRNECIRKQIDQTRNEESQLIQKLAIQEQLLESVKQAYVDTNTIVNKIQHEIQQHRSIKSKIIYSSNLLKLKYNESSIVQSTSLLNVPSAVSKVAVPSFVGATTGGGGDSFDCSGNIGEVKFCSTLLDLELSERSFDTTVIGGGGNESRHNAPPHTLEIKSFASIPLQSFSNISKECAFLIGHNPLVTESQKLSSILQLTPGAILTPSAALQKVQQNLAFADAIASHSTNLQFDFEMEKAEVPLYVARSNSQNEILSQLFDQIDLNALRMQRSLQKCYNILKFIIENPLRHYIPTSITYKNKTYQEYEAEHNTYMSMSTNCDSLK